MSSPFEDPSVPVALTELRDTTFQSETTFACGDYFVIGQGKKDNSLPMVLQSPLKRYTPSKVSEQTPNSETKRTVFTPRNLRLSQALSEIESCGQVEEQSSLPIPEAYSGPQMSHPR